MRHFQRSFLALLWVSGIAFHAHGQTPSPTPHPCRLPEVQEVLGCRGPIAVPTDANLPAPPNLSIAQSTREETQSATPREPVDEHLQRAHEAAERGALVDAQTEFRAVASSSPAHVFALEGNAWSNFLRGEYQESLQQFRSVLRALQRDPSADAALRQRAQQGLLAAYTRSTDHSFEAARLRVELQELTDATTGNRLFEALGEQLLGTSHSRSAAEVFRLLQLLPENASRQCALQARTAVAGLLSDAPGNGVVDVFRLVDVYEQLRVSSAATQRNECRDTTAQLLWSVAVRAHNAIQPASGGFRTVPDHRWLPIATAAYTVLLDRIEGIEQVQYPGIERRYWPSRDQIEFFRAAVPYQQGDFCHAATTLQQFATTHPQHEYAGSARLGAWVASLDCIQTQTLTVSRSSGVGSPPMSERTTQLANTAMEPACQQSTASDFIDLRVRARMIVASLHHLGGRHPQALALEASVVHDTNLDQSTRRQVGTSYLRSLEELSSQSTGDQATTCRAHVGNEARTLFQELCTAGFADHPACVLIAQQACRLGVVTGAPCTQRPARRGPTIRVAPIH